MHASVRPAVSVNISSPSRQRNGEGNVRGPRHAMSISKVNFFYGAKQVLFDIGMASPPIRLPRSCGPSGCGKSTLLRTLNRMH